jgi:hypothetical protein
MADEAEYRSLPFEQAISFFRQKVNVPTAKWADMLQGAHSRAFTVAGATKEGMLTDFRAAIDDAISNGSTLGDFRKSFDDIVARYGWDYNGTRGWRTQTIYGTNLRTAYAAGRWKQMTDPDVLRLNPYWKRVHKDGEKHPRPEHLAWDGLVLPPDDPFVKTHATPDGWGCQCRWDPINRRELASLGKSGPDRAPPIEMQKATVNTSAGPLTIDVPKGVDPGWGYSIGESAYGRQLSAHTMDAWRQQGADAWERLQPSGDWRSAGRPEQLPIDRPKAKFGRAVASIAQLEPEIEAAIGAPEQAFKTPDGDPMLIDAAALSQHMPLDHAALAPILPELAGDPSEIWLAFEQHKGTGQVALRKRLLKAIHDARGRGLVLVAQSSGGKLEALSFIPADDADRVQAQRVGRLIWSRR